MSEDDSFYRQHLQQHDRTGFLWQKLKEPRSYDYLKTQNKSYLERLRMPQFPFSDAEREAVVTFVLGLVADPPADDFLYHPDPRQLAIQQGRQVLDQMNCGGCHVLEPEKWDIEYAPNSFGAPATPAEPDFPFLRPHFTPQQQQASTREDRLRGVLRATITGMAAIDNDTGLPIIWDQEGDRIQSGRDYPPESLQHAFDLWEPAILDGQPCAVGENTLRVPAPMIRAAHAPRGGDFTQRILSQAVQLEKQANPNANGREAWGWLPPPLHRQGHKVQPDWLHDFLLDPHPIRPAVLLQMPKFNLSADEATRLVDYFAASNGAIPL